MVIKNGTGGKVSVPGKGICHNGGTEEWGAPLHGVPLPLRWILVVLTEGTGEKVSAVPGERHFFGTGEKVFAPFGTF